MQSERSIVGKPAPKRAFFLSAQTDQIGDIMHKTTRRYWHVCVCKTGFLRRAARLPAAIKKPPIGGLNYLNRILFFATSKYLSSSSMPMNFRPVLAQATPVVPLPMNGSKIVMPKSVC